MYVGRGPLENCRGSGGPGATLRPWWKTKRQSQTIRICLCSDTKGFHLPRKTINIHINSESTSRSPYMQKTQQYSRETDPSSSWRPSKGFTSFVKTELTNHVTDHNNVNDTSLNLVTTLINYKTDTQFNKTEPKDVRSLSTNVADLPRPQTHFDCLILHLHCRYHNLGQLQVINSQSQSLF